MANTKEAQLILNCELNTIILSQVITKLFSLLCWYLLGITSYRVGVQQVGVYYHYLYYFTSQSIPKSSQTQLLLQNIVYFFPRPIYNLYNFHVVQPCCFSFFDRKQQFPDECFQYILYFEYQKFWFYVTTFRRYKLTLM